MTGILILTTQILRAVVSAPMRDTERVRQLGIVSWTVFRPVLCCCRSFCRQRQWLVDVSLYDDKEKP